MGSRSKELLFGFQLVSWEQILACLYAMVRTQHMVSVEAGLVGSKWLNAPSVSVFLTEFVSLG